MLKQKYFLTDFFILSAEKQPIKSSWRKIEWLHNNVGLLDCGRTNYMFILRPIYDWFISAKEKRIYLPASGMKFTNKFINSYIHI